MTYSLRDKDIIKWRSERRTQLTTGDMVPPGDVSNCRNYTHVTCQLNCATIDMFLHRE
jgi:hypothetical protein